MSRYYFQCDVSDNLPEITEFGKSYNYKLNSAETSAIVLVSCTEEEFITAQTQAGIDEKTFIILTKEESRSLSKSWD